MFYECLWSYLIEEENEWIIITSKKDNLSINNAKERVQWKGKKRSEVYGDREITVIFLFCTAENWIRKRFLKLYWFVLLAVKKLIMTIEQTDGKSVS